MANADHIAAALVALEEESTHLELLMEVFEDLARDQVPAWVGVLAARIAPLTARIDALGDIVRRDVLPLHRDFESMTKGGGMGGLPPMGTQKATGQLAPSRA